MEINSKLLNTKHLVRCLRTKTCDVNVVKQIISRGVDLHFKDDAHNTLIHLALEHCEDKFTLLHELLVAGVPSNVPNNDERSAIHFAVMYSDDVRVLREVIAHGADVNATDLNGNSPLHLAVLGNKKSFVEILVPRSHSVEREKYFDYVSPLVLAVIQDNLEIVKLLLSLGASLTIGFPLVVAVHCRVINRSILIELMSYGAKWSDFDPSRYYAMHEVLLEYSPKKGSKGPLNSIASKNLLSAETLMKCYVLKGKTTINSFPTHFRSYPMYPKLKALYYECVDEISRMQAEFINRNFCLFDFVRKGFRLNPMLQKKTAYREMVFNWIINISRNYPAYAEIIAHHLGKSDLRLKSMELCVYALKDERQIFLTPDSVFLITGALSNVDILNLVIAFSDSQHFATHDFGFQNLSLGKSTKRKLSENC